jgi:1-deoxy-D-xylulose-5-phosphate reductoisomerase
MKNVKKITLTASGGAFRDYTYEQLKNAKAADALRHPTWKMGKKVTIDCATLVNKGIEIVEAKRLFGIDNVDAVMHPQSLVHALVEKKDGNVLACISPPDMKIPIAYALSYPDRLESRAQSIDFAALGKLEFAKIDEERFPCFNIAKNLADDYEGTLFVAADKVLCDLYMQDKIGFCDFPRIFREVLKCKKAEEIASVQQVLRIHKTAEEYTLRIALGGGE